MVKIRIVKPPPGNFPPQWVREAWVGITLDSIGLEGKVQPFDHPHYEGGFEELRTGEANVGGYQVRANEAIEKLEKHHPEAYRWWRQRGNFLGMLSTVLVFHQDVCELLTPSA